MDIFLPPIFLAHFYRDHSSLRHEPWLSPLFKFPNQNFNRASGNDSSTESGSSYSDDHSNFPADRNEQTIFLFTDGAARGNPGPAGAGIVIKNGHGNIIAAKGFYLGRQTNNAAEYLALLQGLKLILERFSPSADANSSLRSASPAKLVILMDSELVVKQLQKIYRVKNKNLANYYQKVQKMLARVPDWRVEHIPRIQNKEADRLANLAIDRQGDVESG